MTFRERSGSYLIFFFIFDTNDFADYYQTTKLNSGKKWPGDITKKKKKKWGQVNIVHLGGSMGRIRPGTYLRDGRIRNVSRP